MKKPADINEYIAGFPLATQKRLKQVRATIKKTAPQADELISYGIAAFKLNNYQLVYFAGFKNHIGLYPAPVKSDLFARELSTYKTGRGSVQFPHDKPLPLDLISRIVLFRKKENEEKSKTKKTTSTIKQSREIKKGEDEKIQAYLDKQDETKRDEINKIRKIIKKAAPALSERIKWNAPSFHLEGTDLFTFGPEKNGRLLIVFHHPAIVKIKSPLLEGNYKDRRLLYFDNKKDITSTKKAFEKIITSLLEKLN